MTPTFDEEFEEETVFFIIGEILHQEFHFFYNADR